MRSENKIAKNIKEWRLEKKLTQQELADKIPCSLKTLQNFENDKKDPTIPMLKQIATAEGILLEKLLSGEIHIHNIEVNEGGINNKGETVNKGITEEKLDKFLDTMMTMMEKWESR